MHRNDDEFSAEETRRRFEAITREVLSTPPLKKKDLPAKATTSGS
jgi:hypothetical protein